MKFKDHQFMTGSLGRKAVKRLCVCVCVYPDHAVWTLTDCVWWRTCGVSGKTVDSVNSHESEPERMNFTHLHKHTHRYRQTNGQMDIQTHMHNLTHLHTHRDKETNRQMDRQTHVHNLTSLHTHTHRDKETNRQMDRQTHVQTSLIYRQTDIQRDNYVI